MDPAFRADLRHILPRPLTLPRGRPYLDIAVTTPAAAAGPAWLLDLGHRLAPGPEDAGFGLQQARQVAAQLAHRLGDAWPGLFALDPTRAQQLLS